jgi:hypothetical protein
MARRGRSDELVIISWRDIPAQVNGGTGEQKHQRILPQRFQGAIDRAAMKAGKKTSGEYVQEWRRSTVALPADFSGDYHAAVLAEAERIENEFPSARLKLWIETGGWNPDRPESERTESGPTQNGPTL